MESGRIIGLHFAAGHAFKVGLIIEAIQSKFAQLSAGECGHTSGDGNVLSV